MKRLLGTEADGAARLLPLLGRPVMISGWHTATGGKTGSGKSWLATHLAIAAARDGSGIVVLDPHASLLANIIRAGAHVLAEKGTVILWPGGPLKDVLPWNPLTNAGGDAAERAADQFLGACARVWGLDAATTARTWRLLKYTAWAVAAAGWTPLEIVPFLTDARFRAYIVNRANRSEVTAWAERVFDGKTTAQLEDLIGPTDNRLAMLATNRELQLLVGLGVIDRGYHGAYTDATGRHAARPGDLARAIDAGVHLLVALPDAALGEDQRLFAALVFDYVLGTIMRRTKDSPGVQTELILDEFPPYVSPAFGKLLAQSRGFRAWAHLFCQGLHQAPPWLQDEIGTNCHRLVGPTQNVHEAAAAAALFVEYHPEGGERSHKDYWANQIKQLPDRTFIAKIGAKPAIRLRTPTVHLRHSLEAGLDLATARVFLPRVSRDAALAELDWRKQWIAGGEYGRSPIPVDPRTAPELLPFDRFSQATPGDEHVGRRSVR